MALKKLCFGMLMSAALAACGSSGASGTSGTGTSGGGTTGGTTGTSSLGDGGFTGSQCTPPSDYTGNSKHVGAYCTRNGGQCSAYGAGLSCAIDLAPSNGGNFCTSILCGSDADCGEDACCTGDANLGAEKGCVPVQCVNNDGGLTCPPGD